MANSEHEVPTLTSDILLKILDNCYDEIQALDGSGTVIYTNKGTERNSGAKVSDVIGKTLSDLMNDNCWNPLATSIVMKEKRQITLKQKSSFGKTAITTSTPVFNDQGELELIVHNTRDFDQIEVLLKELQQSEQQEFNKYKVNEPEFVAFSKAMKETVRYAELVANKDTNVLILGESGSGKGVMIKYIHTCSARKDRPFISINCAAIPDTLLESELFGYCNGAFTGADRNGKKGLIELADGGTLFLDEVAELSPRAQAKLLQFIQERTFIPVGGTQIKEADVRIVAATNNDLNGMVKKGSFRGDLFYRLDVIEITIPPLRERIKDIPPLISYFMQKFNKKYDSNREISLECQAVLGQYFWPGNVRELENLIERLVITTTTNIIQLNHLPTKITQPPLFECDNSFSINVPLDLIMEEMEKNIVVKTYKALGSSRKVGSALNITQTKALRLIKKYCSEEIE